MTQPNDPPRLPRPLPRISRINRFHPPGLRFHVASSSESFRVEKFGGEEDFTQMILDALRPDDVYFDIGTSIGFTALHAAVRCRRVYAFEPDAEFRTRMLENAALNQLINIVPVPWAVSDKVGSITLYTDGVGGNSPALHARAGRPSVTVEAGTIDAGIASNRLEMPGVVKIDIEGAEVKALRGMTTLLGGPKRPRVIFIETHPPMIATLGDDWTDAEQRLAAAGYELTYDEGRADQRHQIFTLREAASQ